MAGPHVLEKFERQELINGFRELIENLPDFLELSRDMAEEEAESYRGFDVGNIAVGIRPGVKGLITVDTANFKAKHLEDEQPDLHEPEVHEILDLHEDHDIPRDIPKVCAEMAAILLTEDDYDLYYIANTIAATGDQELIKAVTKMATRTLTPCEPCVEMLDGAHSTSRATLYISAAQDKNEYQVRNMRMLQQLYKKRKEKVPVAKITKDSTLIALEYFDRRIKSHQFSGGQNSRIISGFAKAALNQTIVT